MAAVSADSNQNQIDTNFSTAASNSSIYISALPNYYTYALSTVLQIFEFNEKLAGVDPEQHKYYKYQGLGPSFRETNSDEYMSLVIIVRKGNNVNAEIY